MTDGPTTARAQRRQAVADGAAADAVDRRSHRRDPRGQTAENTTRNRQIQMQREIEADLDLDPGSVGAVDRIGGGTDAMLRSPGQRQWGARLRGEFASEADFVEADDVDAGIDPDAISARPQVAQGRRDEVADRARREAASEARFITDDDLGAEVGAFGVESLTVREDRRDAVADRTRQQLAGDDRFAEPGDFGVDVTERGVERAELTDSGQRSRAARQFESEFDLFGSGDLDPETDIRETGDGFGLGEAPAREVAAADLDQQLADVDVRPADVELKDTGDGFEAIFEREVQR